MKRLKYQDIVKIVSEFLDEPDTKIEYDWLKSSNIKEEIGCILSVILGKKWNYFKILKRKGVNPIIGVELHRGLYKDDNLGEFKKKFKEFISKKENVYFIGFRGIVKKIENEKALYSIKELGKCFLHSTDPRILLGKRSFYVYVEGMEEDCEVWELSDPEVTIEAL